MTTDAPRGWPPHVAPPMSPMMNPAFGLDQYGCTPPLVAPHFCAHCYEPIKDGELIAGKLFCVKCLKQRKEKCGS